MVNNYREWPSPVNTSNGLGEQHFLQQALFNQNFPKAQKDMMNKMIQEALAKGIIHSHDSQSITQSASEGSVADYVLFTSPNIKLTAKMDEDKKIVNEALFLKLLSERPELPKGFSKHFPRVYAISHKPPYGYIMEYFNMKSLGEHIFKAKRKKESAVKALHLILKILFNVYTKTRDYRIVPNIQNLYLQRITERLEEARMANSKFNKLSNDRITINGQKFETPEFYLEQIDKNVSDFHVNFTTFVHGDCHPENILVGFNEDKEIDIKFIDPKDWYSGDYMYDVGKLAHYLFGTGPAQMVHAPPVPQIDVGNASLNYHLNTEQFHVDELLTIIHKKVAVFAAKVQDSKWKQRYKLSLASNLLGTPPARLKSENSKLINAAFMLYGEGLISLANCV